MLLQATNAVRAATPFLRLEALVKVGLLLVAIAAIHLSRLTVDQHGIDARSPRLRRRRLAWRDVHHLEFRGYWRGLGVWTIDGRWVPLLQYGLYERRTFRDLAVLERYRVERQRALGLF